MKYDYVYDKTAEIELETSLSEGGYFASLGAFWQLQLANENYWPELNKLYRERRPSFTAEKTKDDYMIEYSSEVLGVDLTEHFARHGLHASEATAQDLAATYPTGQKYWYLNTKAWEYEGTGLAQAVQSQITNVSETGLLTVVSDANEADLLGYEVLRDGEVIGFTRTNTFQDPNYQTQTNVNYTVIPYGVNLQPATMSPAYSSQTPTLTVKQPKVTIGMWSDFDPSAYVTATNHVGESIMDQLNIDSTVDTTQKGEYRVTYTLIDAGIEVQQTLDVQVAATVTPASDLVWQSATSGWKTVNKDSAVSVTDPIKLNIDGIVQTFEKGIGAAANAEIVYDLTGTEYEYFTSYVGTDKNFNDTRTTVQFSVLADGVEVYRSSEMGQYSQAEFINLPITGVKELRLIADNVDGNGLGDFTSWGDPQFITVDSKPTLTGVEATTILPFHSKLDLLEGIEANDVEDGDLTSQITVETNGFDSNIPGVYPVTYTVTDSEGNATSQTREITVYSKQTYASDITWQSATSGWKTVNKDSAVSTTNPIKLNVDGEIQTFTKGIGAAANAEIVYDLSGADYEYFTSYVGTDKNYDDTRTTIEFSV
ncbi:MAG: NPCBM/NEW2 domain-containing protein, partial [Culicoidibacterales bacterium]